MEAQLTRHKSDVLIDPKCVVLQLEFTMLYNIHAVSFPIPSALLLLFDGEASADLLLFDFPLHLECYYNYIEFQLSGISTGPPCFLFVLAGPKTFIYRCANVVRLSHNVAHVLLFQRAVISLNSAFSQRKKFFLFSAANTYQETTT